MSNNEVLSIDDDMNIPAAGDMMAELRKPSCTSDSDNKDPVAADDTESPLSSGTSDAVSICGYINSAAEDTVLTSPSGG